MRIVKLLVVVGVMFLMANSAFAATCSTNCETSTLSVTCSGDTCQAGNGTVTCTSTTSCGSGCTMVTTETKSCGAAPSGPGREKNPV